jgi:hypothetical protein
MMPPVLPFTKIKIRNGPVHRKLKVKTPKR